VQHRGRTISAALVALLAACSSGHKPAATATTNPTLPTFPPTTRDPRVPGECATATHAVINYVVGGELHGRLPLGQVVPTTEYEKPAFRALLVRSLDDCASRSVWLRAVTDYADDAAAANRILTRACQLEAVAGNARPACR